MNSGKSLTPEPGFLERHISILRSSYASLTGKLLMDADLSPEVAPAYLDRAPFAVVSHGLEADPIFNYANRTALELFEMDWQQFTQLPSRLSAEPMERNARASLLDRVARHGFIEDYSGVRVSANGNRFMIRNATVWNLTDEKGNPYGQAAMIPEWEKLK